jgi:hypothetical protein
MFMSSTRTMISRADRTPATRGRRFRAGDHGASDGKGICSVERRFLPPFSHGHVMLRRSRQEGPQDRSRARRGLRGRC